MTFCQCVSLPFVLVRHGLFPTAPHSPRVALSIHLLDFYQALFERSCDAIHAFAAALHTFYERRGYRLLNQQVRTQRSCLIDLTLEQGQAMRDPFRRGLASAVQWYDCLLLKVKNQVDTALEECSNMFEKPLPSPSPSSSPPDRTTSQPSQCHRTLQDLCPACFGGTHFGQSFQE